MEQTWISSCPSPSSIRDAIPFLSIELGPDEAAECLIVLSPHRLDKTLLSPRLETKALTYCTLASAACFRPIYIRAIGLHIAPRAVEHQSHRCSFFQCLDDGLKSWYQAYKCPVLLVKSTISFCCCLSLTPLSPTATNSTARASASRPSICPPNTKAGPLIASCRQGRRRQ